jgi:hypothetical protein
LIKKLPLAIIVLTTPLSLMATVDTSIRGYLSAKGNYYLKDADESFGTRARAQLEQETKINSDFTLVNQLRFTYSSLYTDVSSNPSGDSKNTRELYPGDNYIKYKSASWMG